MEFYSKHQRPVDDEHSEYWFIQTLVHFKIIALELLIISLVGATGKKNEKLRLKSILSWIAIGLLFISQTICFLALLLITQQLLLLI